MLRCTIELIPSGVEANARPLGIVEIANTGGDMELGDYTVTLKKTPPWKGALKSVWKKGKLTVGYEDEEVIVGGLEGFHRQKRGPYDLLFCALIACGLDSRNKAVRISEPELPPLTPHTAWLVLLGAVHTDELTEELVASWTDEQREVAVAWASAAICEASDNIVDDMPPKPDFLPADRPFQMQPLTMKSSA
ncbi:MAG: hypothetical protein KAS66_05390 [Candidatus Omnitrophica bacterium]|nr:hypothetical protein [Candidatus Omnitrophota bacterium]